ncbi:MAG: leucine--tRNA ligase, partial [Treponema sp.]|nr:leucine--tRNA ligase [Treponema sp.]
TLDWPESVKLMQKNWIGRSTGATVQFAVADECGNATAQKIAVYTTRPDTLFGATYLVIAPEHPLSSQCASAEYRDAVSAYIDSAARKSDLERTDLAKDKSGVFTGRYAVNPATGAVIPIWISDYVLVSYGTGAIMAVPAHDERDWDFAQKFGLPIQKVVASKAEIAALADGDERKGAALLVDAARDAATYEAFCKAHPMLCTVADGCTSADGYAINSAQFTGRATEQAKADMIAWLSAKQVGAPAVNYKLRDWVFSRQRYWGEPIPLVHCSVCGIVPLDESDLPLVLPDVETYQPTGTGESPLANIADWVNCTCPKCGGAAQRETNTMPQWAGSCWYYLRYLDPHNETEFCAHDKETYWMPVDLYVGGAEHAVLHLLYARFWHKVLYDIGAVHTVEPFQRLINQGMITSFAYQRKNKTLVPADEVTETAPGRFIETATGEVLEQIVAKMSKTLKNVVNPDDQIKKYGADSVRLYEMFMGPLTISKPWNTQGIIGIQRFLEKVWSMSEKPIVDCDITGQLEDTALVAFRKTYAQTVKKVTEDTETLSFNTAISQMMIFINEATKQERIPRSMWEGFVKMLSCYAPHLGEELWEKLGHNGTIAYEPWPVFDEQYVTDSTRTITVMVNGKLRDTFETAPGTPEETLKTRAFETDGAQKHTAGKQIVKIIVVPDKLVNLVVK